ncbi:enoyl-CoA hydratase [Salinarimonas soli]|uniref:Enoyl-CoA hydratase n=1 Tax=Salinarimonas soli TaxID=1638099 RepID=A0A5B2VFA3_9HYPH|nr:enoyl-CoA hydratase [Salinarimonas soli]KAA2237052.1 enoyl-CoA hydratase [Salinarimonas soli]
MSDPLLLPSPTAKLRLALDGAVATLSIDNPARRNALDLEMWRALPEIAAGLARDERVRALVVRGAGDGPFASGADIAEFETVRADAAGGRAYEAANEAAFDALAALPQPTIAMIRGFCLGGGFGLALACDLRIAGRDAVFGIPAGRLGVGYPPGAMRMVVAAMGAAAAKDLFFTARRIDAETARSLGVVRDVVAPEALEAEVAGLAQVIAANAPLTLRAAKAAIDKASGIAAPDGSAAALAAACFDSEDYREGRTAFLDKRAPVFRGR